MTASRDGLTAQKCPTGTSSDGKAPVLSSPCPNTNPPAWLWPGYHCRQDHDLRIRYGITCGDYWRLFERQGGRCAVCGGRPGKRRLAVDHDHDTGEIRGLCHVRCQRWITVAVVRYLASPPGRDAELVVPAAKLRKLEARARAKQAARAKTRDQQGPRVAAATSLRDQIKATTRQGGA